MTGSCGPSLRSPRPARPAVRRTRCAPGRQPGRTDAQINGSRATVASGILRRPALAHGRRLGITHSFTRRPPGASTLRSCEPRRRPGRRRHLWSRRRSQRPRWNAGSCAAGPTSWRGRCRWRCSPPAARQKQWVAEGSGLVVAQLPRLLPRRHPQRAVAGARHRPSSSPDGASVTGCDGVSSWPPGSRRASWSRLPSAPPVSSDELPEGSEPFEPLPRILAAVGLGVRPRRRRRAPACGVHSRLGRRRRPPAPHRRRPRARECVVEAGTPVRRPAARLPGGREGHSRSRSRSWPASSCCSADSSSPRQGGRPFPGGSRRRSACRSADEPRALLAQLPPEHLAGKGCGAARPTNSTLVGHL